MFDFAIIEECKVSTVPTIIVKSIMKVETAIDPLKINVNYKGKSLVSYKPKTKEDALKLAKEWINKGYTVDIGLMQFNSSNLKYYPDYTVKELFDPCINIKLSTSIYNNNFSSTNKKLPYSKRVLQSLSAYNTGSFTKGFKNGYVAKYKPYLANYLNIKTERDSLNYAKYLLRAKAPSNLIYNY